MTQHAHMLDSMPADRAGARAWLNALRFDDFDSLWVSGYVSLIAEGDIGAGDVAHFLSTVRERYRAELAKTQAKQERIRPTIPEYRTRKLSLNDRQKRIALHVRDLPGREEGMQRFLAQCFGCSHSTINELWHGRKRRAA